MARGCSGVNASICCGDIGRTVDEQPAFAVGADRKARLRAPRLCAGARGRTVRARAVPLRHAATGGGTEHADDHARRALVDSKQKHFPGERYPALDPLHVRQAHRMHIVGQASSVLLIALLSACADDAGGSGGRQRRGGSSERWGVGKVIATIKTPLQSCALSIWASALVLSSCDAPQPLVGAADAIRPLVSRSYVDRDSYLFVANDQIPDGQRVNVYLRSDPYRGVIRAIRTGVSEPAGIFIDDAGTLYVASADRVTVYPKGARRPSRVYKMKCAADVVAGSDGTVYVADPCGTNGQGEVHVFAPNSTKQIRLLRPGGAPYSVTLDSQNRLYVGYTIWPNFAGQVRRYGPGASHGLKMLPDKTVENIGSIRVDKHGALLVANDFGGVIDVFTGVRKPPSRILKTGQTFPSYFAFDRDENRLFVSAPFYGSLQATSGSGGQNPNTVAELEYPSGKVLLTFKPGGYPMGVAVSPSAPL